jgi:hypothetical protein
MPQARVQQYKQSVERGGGAQQTQSVNTILPLSCCQNSPVRELPHNSVLE